MIKTTIIALIEGRRYEFTSELAEVAPWAHTAAETALGLLHADLDTLTKAITPSVESAPRPAQVTDENGNYQCYLCGFFHDEPGSCATGTPTNITPGPDSEPEYDGPTMDDADDDHWFWASRGDTDPDSDDDDDDEDSDWDGPEDGDYADEPDMPPPCKRVQEYRDGWDGPESGDYVEPREPDMPPFLMNLNIAAQSVADIVRERIGRSVVEASRRDEADQ